MTHHAATSLVLIVLIKRKMAAQTVKTRAQPNDEETGELPSTNIKTIVQ